MPIHAPRRILPRTLGLAAAVLAAACGDARVPTAAVPAAPMETSLPATATAITPSAGLNAVNGNALAVGTRTSSTADSAIAWSASLGRRVLATLDTGKKTGVWDRAHAVNEAGQIVGESNDRNGAQRAVLWSSYTAQPQDLGSLRPTGISAAHDINGQGLVVGGSETAAGQYHAFTWTSAAGMTDISGGAPSTARAVNDSGTVVGGAQVGGQTRAFVWTQAGGMQVLGTLGGTLSEALDVNLKSQVVGRSRNAAGQMRAFYWTAAAGFRDLGTLGGTTSVATGINDAGLVVGYSTNAAGQTRAFAWTPRAGMRDLGALGHPHASAAAINRWGTAVGGATDAAGVRQAVRWQIAEVNSRPTIDFAKLHDTVWEGDTRLLAPAWSDADDDPLYFAWVFGDGTSLNQLPTRTPAPVNKMYRDQGTFGIRVIASDPTSAMDTATQTMVVLNRAPTGTFTLPFGSQLEGSPYTLRTSGVTDGPADVAAGIQIAFSCGYGVFTAYARTTSVACPALADQDTLTVALRLRDKDGAVTEDARTLIIHNAAPVTTISAGSATTLPVTGSFTAGGSFTDAGANDAPWMYRYFWGDGTITKGFVSARGAVPSASHAYRAPGTYRVQLMVSDKELRTGMSAFIDVTVTP